MSIRIKPANTNIYNCEQRRHVDIVPQLPMKSLILGPYGSGKSILLQHLITDMCKGCFERVYIFSPSINLDNTWTPDKQYIEKELQPIDGEPPMLYDNYRAGDLSTIMPRQNQVVDFMKKNDYKNLRQILIVIDDCADHPRFTRNNELLHSRCVRSRHSFISTITATQVNKAISPVIRKDSTHLFVFKFRNQTGLNASLEEFSVLYDQNVLLKMYKDAMDEKTLILTR